METKKLEIITKTVEYVDANGKKKTFLAYNTFDKDGVRLDVRFLKEVKAPVEHCFIIVAVDKMNISNKYRFPRLYVKEIVEIVPLEVQSQDLPF